MSSIPITSSRAHTASRHAAIRAVNRKKAFWRHVSVYGVLNVSFWTSWVIAGIHEQWIAPWPLIPTIVWGLIIVVHGYRLGGPTAVSHATIATEVYALTHPDEPVSMKHPIKRPITYEIATSTTPLRPFHWREVIDARDSTTIRTSLPKPEREAGITPEASTSS